MQGDRVPVQRIVVRGVNWLGDAIMTIPALMRLRERFPKGHVAMVTLEKLAPVWQGNQFVDEVISIRKGESPWRVGRRLRQGRFDLGLVLPNSFRSAWELRWGGVKDVRGYGSQGRKWLLSQVVPLRAGHVRMRKLTAREVRQRVARGGERLDAGLDAGAHQLLDYLHLMQQTVGASAEPAAPRVPVGEEEKQFFRDKFLRPVGGERWAGINPGAEYGPAKRWPAERFVDAAAKISERAPVHWILFGAAADVERCGQIEQAWPAGIRSRLVNVSGRTGLRELAAGLSLCEVVLSNDTGPMHLAAAVGSRVIVPFGSTSPTLTGPGKQGGGGHALLRGTVPCAPCYRKTCPIDVRCLGSVTADAVAVAALGLLGRPVEKGERTEGH